MIGRTLSHYRVNAAIDKGDIGQVYRATDSKLGREVAPKVLPPNVADDPERLARFQRGIISLITQVGEWERGSGLVERARGLNPHHPGWYWLPSFIDAYCKNEFRGALDFALTVNMPSFWRANLAFAAAYGQLGEQEAARAAVQELLAPRPDFPAVAHEELGAKA